MVCKYIFPFVQALCFTIISLCKLEYATSYVIKFVKYPKQWKDSSIQSADRVKCDSIITTHKLQPLCKLKWAVPQSVSATTQLYNGQGSPKSFNEHVRGAIQKINGKAFCSWVLGKKCLWSWGTILTCIYSSIECPCLMIKENIVYNFQSFLFIE